MKDKHIELMISADKNHNPRKGTETKAGNLPTDETSHLEIRTIIPARGRKPDEAIYALNVSIAR